MSDEIKVQELEKAAGGKETGHTNTGYTVYKTEAGDTLWGLSQKYGVDVYKLFEINKQEITKWYKKMNPGKPVPADNDLMGYLYIGETLYIPPKGV